MVHDVVGLRRRRAQGLVAILCRVVSSHLVPDSNISSSLVMADHARASERSRRETRRTDGIGDRHQPVVLSKNSHMTKEAGMMLDTVPEFVRPFQVGVTACPSALSECLAQLIYYSY